MLGPIGNHAPEGSEIDSARSDERREQEMAEGCGGSAISHISRMVQGVDESVGEEQARRPSYTLGPSDEPMHAAPWSPSSTTYPTSEPSEQGLPGAAPLPNKDALRREPAHWSPPRQQGSRLPANRPPPIHTCTTAVRDVSKGVRAGTSCNLAREIKLVERERTVEREIIHYITPRASDAADGDARAVHDGPASWCAVSTPKGVPSPTGRHPGQNPGRQPGRHARHETRSSLSPMEVEARSPLSPSQIEAIVRTAMRDEMRHMANESRGEMWHMADESRGEAQAKALRAADERRDRRHRMQSPDRRRDAGGGARATLRPPHNGSLAEFGRGRPRPLRPREATVGQGVVDQRQGGDLSGSHGRSASCRGRSPFRAASSDLSPTRHSPERMHMPSACANLERRRLERDLASVGAVGGVATCTAPDALSRSRVSHGRELALGATAAGQDPRNPLLWSTSPLAPPSLSDEQHQGWRAPFGGGRHPAVITAAPHVAPHAAPHAASLHGPAAEAHPRAHQAACTRIQARVQPECNKSD